MADKEPIIKSHCNKCGRETNQVIRYEFAESGREYVEFINTSDPTDVDTMPIDWSRHSRIMQCRGCDTVSFRIDYSDDTTDVPDTTLYPSSEYRPKPRWMDTDEFRHSCPARILGLYKELYVTLQNECYSAASMCARAILELTMIDKVGDQGSFAANLDAFVAGGFMLPARRAALEAALNNGGATIHRGYEPNAAEIDVLLIEVESLLTLVYLNDKHIMKLTARVPPRPARVKTSKTPMASSGGSAPSPSLP